MLAMDQNLLEPGSPDDRHSIFRIGRFPLGGIKGMRALIDEGGRQIESLLVFASRFDGDPVYCGRHLLATQRNRRIHQRRPARRHQNRLQVQVHPGYPTDSGALGNPLPAVALALPSAQSGFLRCPPLSIRHVGSSA
jgi:hypothetical protein